MFDVEVELTGVAELAKKFQKAPELLRKESVKMIEQEGRTLAFELGFATNPFGIKDPVKYKGRIRSGVDRIYAGREKAIRNDAWKVYSLIKEKSSADASAFWGSLKAENWERAQQIMRKNRLSTKVDRADYKQFRGVKNRIPVGVKPIGVAAVSRIEALINKQIKTVGTAKAGWFQAQKGIGGRTRGSKQFPAWVRKAGSKKAGNLGGAEKRYNSFKPELTLVNRVRYISYALKTALYFRALDKAQERIKREMEDRWNAINKRKFK